MSKHQHNDAVYAQEGTSRIFSIVALDIFLTVTLFATFWASDFTLLSAMLGAWAGGCFLTIGTYLTLGYVKVRSEATGLGIAADPDFHRAAATPVQTQIQNLCASGKRSDPGYAAPKCAYRTLPRSSEQSVAAMLQGWEADAVAEQPCAVTSTPRAVARDWSRHGFALRQGHFRRTQR